MLKLARLTADVFEIQHIAHLGELVEGFSTEFLKTENANFISRPKEIEQTVSEN
jgi:hypothetical protein